MKVYIKDSKTFYNKAIVDAYSYQLVKSIYTDLSELTVQYNENIAVGDIIYDNYGWIARISSVEKDGQTLQLKAEDITYLFNRDIIFTSSDMKSSTEQTLLQALQKYYKNQSDEVYALPYLNLAAYTMTSNLQPAVEYGLWSIKSYISRVRRLQGVYADIKASASTLDIFIQRKELFSGKIFTTNQYLEITEETFSNTSIGKVTAYTQGGSATDYYLLEDGTITTTYQAYNRVPGEWVYLEIQEGEDELTQVKNKFKENSYSHKVTFVVPKDKAKWEFYDPVMIEVNKLWYQSYIAKKIIKDDGTTEYQCGELKTSLTDKINQVL